MCIFTDNIFYINLHKICNPNMWLQLWRFWLWCNITVIVQCQSRFQITLLTYLLKQVKPKLGVHSCANLHCSCCTFRFRYGTFYRQQLLSNQFLLTWIVHDVNRIAVRIWYGYLKLPFISNLNRFYRLWGNGCKNLSTSSLYFFLFAWNSMRNIF